MTRFFTASATPRDAAEALNLPIGQVYQVQNLSTTATVYWLAVAVPDPENPPAAPTAGSDAHRIEAGGTAAAPVGGFRDRLYVWTDAPEGAKVALTPAGLVYG